MKNIKRYIGLVIFILLFTGCGKKMFVIDKLRNNTANTTQITNYLEGNILTISLPEDIENLVSYLPKDNMTVRLRLSIPNIEDVVYISIKADNEFNINKLLIRANSKDDLDANLNKDMFLFEPSKEQDIVIVQLYMPSVYLYNNLHNLKVEYAYKRDLRVLQDSLNANFIRFRYYVKDIKKYDDIEAETPQYTNQKDFCVDNGLDQTFLDQVNNLNTNRVDKEVISKLKGMCE